MQSFIMNDKTIFTFKQPCTRFAHSAFGGKGFKTWSRRPWRGWIVRGYRNRGIFQGFTDNPGGLKAG